MSLRGFLDHMDKIGQVFRVRNELSANFEIPQVMKSLNPNDRILLFEKVKRYPTGLFLTCAETAREYAMHSALAKTSFTKGCFRRGVNPIKQRLSQMDP